MGGGVTSNLENWPSRKAKTVVQCISAGQPTGPRTIGQLLLLKIKVTSHRQKIFAGQPLTPHQKFSEVTTLTRTAENLDLYVKSLNC